MTAAVQLVGRVWAAARRAMFGCTAAQIEQARYVRDCWREVNS